MEEQAVKINSTENVLQIYETFHFKFLNTSLIVVNS
jgi:hypothetical protein